MNRFLARQFQTTVNQVGSRAGSRGVRPRAASPTGGSSSFSPQPIARGTQGPGFGGGVAV